jgi:predicted AlkP superfamily phosphohydrolase/phosphomutase/tetratricopeptide (TPR) repeat protein
MKRFAKRILLIGWDAADWKIINPLMDAGYMPAMEKLVNGGVMGNMHTLEPPFSPMLWTSIATGKYADKHGILGFTEPDPEGMGMRPVSSLSRKTKAIWNILSQNGLKTHVLGWWPSNPVEPINGIMLSNQFQHSRNKLYQPWPLVTGSVHPELLHEFFAELRVHPQELSDQHLLPFVPEAALIDQSKDPRLHIIAKNLAEVASLHAAATWILETQPWDFLALYLDTIDHFCHGFMKYHPPRLDHVPEEEFNRYKNVITSTYRFHDMMLETLIKLAGDDTTIILISDHGFHSDHLRTTYIPDEPAGPADHHREHGIVCIKGEGIKKDELIYGTSLLNITPTILTLFGLPMGKDMDGIPIVQAFEEKIQVETIPSWDIVDGNHGMHPQSHRTDPIEARNAIQQLIDLGYIEDPGPDKQKAAEKAEKETQYNLARVYISNFRYAEAITLLEELYNHEKEQGRFALRLARCYIDTGNYEKAEKTLQEFLTLAQNCLQDPEVMKKELEQKISETPEKKNVWEKDFHKQIRRQVTLQNNIGQAHLLLFDIRILQEKPQAILQELEKKFPEEKRPLSVQHKLANMYLKTGQFKKAEVCFQTLIQYNPESPLPYNGLALVYLAKNENDKAAHAALDAIGLDYYQPFSHFYLGEALGKLNDYENASNAYEVCLKILPSFGSARNKLIEIYNNKLDKPELSQKHLEFFQMKNKPLSEEVEEDDMVTLELSELQSRIIDIQDPIVVVSGLPRSGTSLMMQMLEAGGVPVLTDQKRSADENNPRGYYELEAVRNLRKDKRWLSEAQGKSVKVISQLLPYLPAKYNYKVIVMIRDLSEIVQSQHKMLVRMGKKKADTYPARLEMAFRNQMLRVKDWLQANYNVAYLFINYRDVIENPAEAAMKVSQFLGFSLDVPRMAAQVDTSLYRTKLNKSS